VRAPCGRQCRRVLRTTRILYEKKIQSKLSGNKFFYTNSLISLAKNMLCSKFHCQKAFYLIPFSYKIRRITRTGAYRERCARRLSRPDSKRCSLSPPRPGPAWFGIWGLGFGVWIWALGCGVWGLGFGDEGLGFGVWGLGFGVWGLRFDVWGLGFGV